MGTGGSVFGSPSSPAEVVAVAGGDGFDTRVLTSTPDRGVAGSSPTVGEEGGSPASPDGVGTVVGLVPQELDVASSPSVSLG